MIQMPPVQTKFFPFNGGLDEVTPPIELNPGVIISGSNIEVGVNGGYARLGGYERFSGLAKPSAAAYAVLTCNITGTVALNDVLTDAAGTSYGTVISLPSGQAVLTKITGTFSTGNIKVGATVVGTCTGAQATNGASTVALNATYLNLAADVYRALIAAVPGSGSVLGVWQYNSSVYAIRNNAGDTAAVLHIKHATTGWTAVPLGYELNFTSGGTAEPLVGTVLTGDTSTKTATITKIILTSGTWAGGDAAGRIFFASQSGAFTSGENFSASGSVTQANILTMTLTETAITLTKSGRYEFVNWNFGGGKKMYGCDGVNKGFEFDGTHWVKINTGQTTDTPSHVFVNKNHLFFSFLHSAQHSGIGTPYIWTPVSGAAEISCGDTITGFIGLPGTASGAAMGIYTRNRTLVLYGDAASGSNPWSLVPFSEESGSLPYTMQYITQGFCLDTQGIMSLSTTQEYGNFQNAVVSQKVSKTLDPIISYAVASCVVRKKNQYRVFFSNGTALYMTLKNKNLLGITPVKLVDAVTCICSAEGSSGTEEIYFGSTDGFVYQMDIGTSFDGDPIAWNAELAYNHCGSPRQLKTFRKGVTEVTGTDYCEFSAGYSLSYGSTEYAPGTTLTSASNLSQMNWDNFTWDQFFWDGRSLTPSEFDITGTAENISLVFSGNSDEFQSFTLNGEIIHYTVRRQLR